MKFSIPNVQLWVLDVALLNTHMLTDGENEHSVGVDVSEV